MTNEDCQHFVNKPEKYTCGLTGNYCVARESRDHSIETHMELLSINPHIFYLCPARQVSKDLAQKIKVELVQISVDELGQEHAEREKEIRSRLEEK